MPVPPERLLLDLETVAEQDQDERDDREALDELRRRVEVERAEPGLPEHEAGEDEAGRQREEAAVGEPGDERAEHQQHAERRERRVEELNPRPERHGATFS